MYIKNAKVFPLVKWTKWKPNSHLYRKVIGGSEVLCGAILSFIPGQWVFHLYWTLIFPFLAHPIKQIRSFSDHHLFAFVCLFLCWEHPFVNFMILWVQNHGISFNQSWQKASFGKKESCGFSLGWPCLTKIEKYT